MRRVSIYYCKEVSVSFDISELMSLFDRRCIKSHLDELILKMIYDL